MGKMSLSPGRSVGEIGNKVLLFDIGAFCMIDALDRATPHGKETEERQRKPHQHFAPTIALSRAGKNRHNARIRKPIGRDLQDAERATRSASTPVRPTNYGRYDFPCL